MYFFRLRFRAAVDPREQDEPVPLVYLYISPLTHAVAGQGGGVGLGLGAHQGGLGGHIQLLVRPGLAITQIGFQLLLGLVAVVDDLAVFVLGLLIQTVYIVIQVRGLFRAQAKAVVGDALFTAWRLTPSSSLVQRPVEGLA